MELVRRLPEDQWRRFVDNHPHGQVFHTPEMFRVFARAKGHHPSLWAATGRDGSVLALLLPVYVSMFNGLPHRLTTRAVAYASVLHAPGEEGTEALSMLLDSYKRLVPGAPLFTELRNLSNLAAAQTVLQQHGFAYEDHLNYLIDLKRSPEDIMGGIGARTRKQIRRAIRRGEVAIEEADNRSRVGAVFDLLSQTYLRARVPLADRSLFEAAFDVLHPKGMIKFTLARVGKDPAAASVELLYKDIVYGWYGGTARDFGAYQPNEVLTWHILEWGAVHGYRVYDFGGAGKPDEEYGVRDFKSKFGGELVSFGRNVFVHSPRMLRISEWGYQTYRKLRSASRTASVAGETT